MTCPACRPLSLPKRLRDLRTARQIRAMQDRAHIQWAAGLARQARIDRVKKAIYRFVIDDEPFPTLTQLDELDGQRRFL